MTTPQYGKPAPKQGSLAQSFPPSPASELEPIRPRTREAIKKQPETALPCHWSGTGDCPQRRAAGILGRAWRAYVDSRTHTTVAFVVSNESPSMIE